MAAASAESDTLLQDSHFRSYLTARGLSVAGSSASFVAMPLLVHETTGSALLTSMVVSINGLIYLALGLPIGAWCDRIDRWRSMISADLLRAAVLLTVPIAFWMDQLSAAHLLIVVAIASALFVLFDAANLGFLTSLVGKERLPSAHGVTGSVTASVEILGPIAVGLIIAVASPAAAIAFDAMTFILSAVLISRIRVTTQSRAGTSARLGVLITDGLRLVYRDRQLRALMILLIALALSEGAYFGQYIPLSLERLGLETHDGRIALLVTSMGVGTLIGSATLASVIRRLGGPTRLIAFAAPASGVAAFPVAISANWIAVCFLLVLWSLLYMWAFMSATVARQQRAGLEYQSRVATVGRMACLGIGVPAGAFAAGCIASASSSMAGVVAVMGVSLAAVLIAVPGIITAERGGELADA